LLRNIDFWPSILGLTALQGGFYRCHLSHLLQERQQIFRFIKDHTEIFPVEKMCSVFKVSRGGFYAWRNSIPSNRSLENQLLEAEILTAFVNSKKIYGSPRITRELH
jgi:hypothetical protein